MAGWLGISRSASSLKLVAAATERERAESGDRRGRISPAAASFLAILVLMLILMLASGRSLLCLRPALLPRRFAGTKAPADGLKFPSRLPAYSSEDSLHNMYPHSRLDMTVVPEVPVAASPTEFSGFIPMSKLSVRYARSGGPGGQHAHKTNTKVSVSFHLESADWIPETTRNELMRIVSCDSFSLVFSLLMPLMLEQHRKSINKDGFWAVKSERTRAQTLNLADCLDKIRCYIQEATIETPVVPFELLEERRSRAERAAAARLQEKRFRSQRKQDKCVSIKDL